MNKGSELIDILLKKHNLDYDDLYYDLLEEDLLCEVTVHSF